MRTYEFQYMFFPQNWQAETKNTINQLSESSENVVQQLHTSVDLQNKFSNPSSKSTIPTISNSLNGANIIVIFD